MGKVEPLDLMQSSIDDEMILLDDSRTVIDMGDSVGVTIPPTAQKNGDFSGSVECHYDPGTGALVFLPDQ